MAFFWTTDYFPFEPEQKRKQDKTKPVPKGSLRNPAKPGKRVRQAESAKPKT